MPKAFSTAEKELIQRRLLDQADLLFSARGLKKVSVEELAQAAGISKGAFYLFYPTKEALYMDAVEQAEGRFRITLLDLVGQPGPSPRLRLANVLRQAFRLFKTIPLLQAFNSADLELLMQRVPAQTILDHQASDEAFIRTLIQRCQSSGIPVRLGPQEISGLLYALLFAFLHQDGLLGSGLSPTLDILCELVAAYCLGEIEVQPLPSSPDIIPHTSQG
jgi:AcrR family transcriptional regulator